jgi:N-acetylglutamate synthase-like GNAT family acetyltransferase
VLNVDISYAKIEERDLINEFFRYVLMDTFINNEISELVDTLNDEIEDKRRCLEQAFESAGKERCFLIAKHKGFIVGSVEYGPPNDLILSCTNGELRMLTEIGTVFVHPEYQKKGIGSQLLISILLEMKKSGIEEFCLDSGYKIAQRIWISKLGRPQYHLKDYWGKNADHMIWRKNVDEVLSGMNNITQ